MKEDDSFPKTKKTNRKHFVLFSSNVQYRS
ncbi:hypothetical protein ACVPOS_03855 [Staphylococcus aureus]